MAARRHMPRAHSEKFRQCGLHVRECWPVTWVYGCVQCAKVARCGIQDARCGSYLPVTAYDRCGHPPDFCSAAHGGNEAMCICPQRNKVSPLTDF